MTCRGCGCTDNHACIDRGVPCHWAAPGLCSACAREMLKTARVGLERESRLMRRKIRRASAPRRDAGGIAGRGALRAALRVQRARKGR